MTKDDLSDLRRDLLKTIARIDAIEATEAFWNHPSGDLPGGLFEIGRLRVTLYLLLQTVARVRRIPDSSDIVGKSLGLRAKNR